MLIPIFGSCPTYLNKDQDDAKRLILGELGHAGMEWRSVGQTDYPTSYPLREVRVLAKHCCGGVILGFSQFVTTRGIWKAGTPKQEPQQGTVAFPTPWNHLESGILFALDVPLLIFREKNISGGIFDNGVSTLFIHELEIGKLNKQQRKSLREVIRKFAADAHLNYYRK
jgi:hypothetical protein